MKSGVTAANDYNEDFVLFDKPVHAIADGEVIACWRNAPNSIRPGDKDAEFPGTPHPGCVSTNRAPGKVDLPGARFVAGR